MPEDTMGWMWNWWVFALLLVLCTITNLMSRGFANFGATSNLIRGSDYQADPSGVLVKSTIESAIYAALITALASLKF